MTIQVFIICGTGVATATAAEFQIKKALENNGIDAVTRKIRAGDTGSSSHKADIIVALTGLPVEVDVPVISGIPFLTGVGKEEAIQKLLDAIASVDN